MNILLTQETAKVLSKPRTKLPSLTTLLTHFESYGNARPVRST